MGKYCGKCSAELSDDDFLCPHCGAIWGDRIYRIPEVEKYSQEDREVEETFQQDSMDDNLESANRKPIRWGLLIAPLCIILAVVIFLAGSDLDPWAGESSTPSSSSEHMTIGQYNTSVPLTLLRV